MKKMTRKPRPSNNFVDVTKKVQVVDVMKETIR